MTFLLKCRAIFFIMNIEEVRYYCLSKPYTEECFPFDEDTLVFKVFGKMYAMIMLEKPSLISLKCDPDYAVELREKYIGINSAWHMNKKHWNQVSILGDISDSLIYSLIDHSYDAVIAKLPKKTRIILKN